MRRRERFPFDLELFSISFRFHPTATIVNSNLKFRKLSPDKQLALELNVFDLNITSVSLNGCRLQHETDFETIENISGGGKIILVKADALALGCESTFTISTETVLNPSQNETFRGLCLIQGVYVTQVGESEPRPENETLNLSDRVLSQCEAYGLRHITAVPDRPDVLARYSPKALLPFCAAGTRSNHSRTRPSAIPRVHFSSGHITARSALPDSHGRPFSLR